MFVVSSPSPVSEPLRRNVVSFIRITSVLPDSRGRRKLWLHGQDQLSAHVGRDQTKGPSNADRGHSLPSLVTPRGGSVSDSVEEKEGTGFECRGGDQMTDWNWIRSEAEGKGIVPEAFPVIVSDRGPEWVPPDPGGVTRLVEFMDKRGLKSPLTLNALQTLAALGPLLPRDITNLMRVVLRLVQYTLWETDWMAELGGVPGRQWSARAAPCMGPAASSFQGRLWEWLRPRAS